MIQKKCFGVSKPFSLNQPTQEDLEETKNIIELLTRENNFPTREENLKREEVLGKTYQICKEFVLETAQKLGIGDLGKELGCKLVTSGSYRLGVHGPGADIDTICIFSKQIKPSDFFETLAEKLRKREEVTKITVVRDAIVPLIKLVFDTIELDLSFAPLRVLRIPEKLNILDIENLKGVNEITQRALNGPRVAEDTLSLVNNRDAFRIALRILRIWGKNRYIYSNANGYLGGVHMSILVARICQLFPFSSANVIVKRFFQVYGSAWKWPTPVILKKIESVPDKLQGEFKVWDPIHNPNHIMPIITPAFPSMCTTHNVNVSTMRIILEEFKRGEKLLDVKKRHPIETYARLIEKSDFFIRFKTFLRIDIKAVGDEENLNKWFGWVDSRMRFFVMYIKGQKGAVDDSIKLQLCPAAFSCPEEEFIEVDTIDETTQTTKKEKKRVYSKTKFIGLEFVNKTTNFNLVGPNQRFHQLINSWKGKTEEMLEVKISSVKRSKIPTWVLSKEDKKLFIQRKKRDRKEKELEKQKEEAQNPKKRKISEVEDAEDAENPKKKKKSEDGEAENVEKPKEESKADQNSIEDQENSKSEETKPQVTLISYEEEENVFGIPSKVQKPKKVKKAKKTQIAIPSIKLSRSVRYDRY